MNIRNHILAKKNRAHRVRTRLQKRSNRPRLVIKRSNKNIHAQIIDLGGKVLASASSLALKTPKINKTKQASEVGVKLADLAAKSKVKDIVLDRSHYRFHGRIKALVESLREKGISI